MQSGSSRRQLGAGHGQSAVQKAFVKAYEAAYNSVPGTYAMQAYDTAMLIDSAIKGTGGDLSDKDALRAELKKANFTSLRASSSSGSTTIRSKRTIDDVKTAVAAYERRIAWRRR